MESLPAHFAHQNYRSDLLNALRVANVEDIVAADERLADVTLAFAVDPLLRIEELQIHVAVEGDECALVFHAPFKLDNHGLVDQVNQEGLRINRDWLSVCLLPRWLRCSCLHLFITFYFTYYILLSLILLSEM